MVDILITKKSTAIIFQETLRGDWKIVFGDFDKKIINYTSSSLDDTVSYVKKLGFGGYKVIDHLIFLKCRLSLEKIKKTKVNLRINKFSDEKDWQRIYNFRNAIR